MIASEQWNLPVSALAAFALTVTTIPITERIAEKLGVVAPTNQDRPGHEVVPLLAGVPITVAIGLSLGLFSTLPRWILIGGGGLMVVGVLDDAVALRPRSKFTLQLIIVAAAVAFWQTPILLPLPWLNSALVILWLLSTVNAFNLIDGLDGVAGGVGIAIALSVAAIGGIHHNFAIVCPALAIAGALAGFLIFNLHPASIFMGDCGALPLGFLLGALALGTPESSANSRLDLYVLPVLVMLVPLLDMAVVSISRTAARSPITLRGHDHSHHRLLAQGLPEQTVAMVCWTVAALAGVCAFGLASTTYAYAVIALPFILAVFGSMAFFMIDLTFKPEVPRTASLGSRGFARLLLNFGHRRRLAEGLLDLALISGAYFGAFLIRLDFEINSEKIQQILPNLRYVLAASYTAFFVTGVYRGIWRYAGLADVPRLAYAAIAAGIALIAESYFVPVMLSGSVVVLFVILLFNLLAASRLSFKGFRGMTGLMAPRHRRVLIVGAGDIGEAAARFVTESRAQGMKVVGLVDGDPSKGGMFFYGSRVLGTVANLLEIERTVKFNEILIACDPIAADQMESLLAFASIHALPVRRFSIQVREITRPLNPVTARASGYSGAK
jgi:UDP-GlcNAc:undecaprenyl-phosphate GlcNAc-1-phosphate transferase